ncbi:hypothetical protein M8C21_033028 [Ambrosia artemisiifolia]|uniref:Uncharacterized protein n=1 Tax=Ambrosia artemisiifolia TaxID=4212 RepID=A0AAD5C5E5_AMBAR|nr:hypothetical protein M8C21_033028 [Ambrosia artemisiifolia]
MWYSLWSTIKEYSYPESCSPLYGQFGKATGKPKSAPVPQNITVIEISPDTVEEKAKPESSSKRNKKPQSSLTATLTARSKATCGLNYKPKPKNIVDIDAADVGKELAEVEYVEDIYKFYKLVEENLMRLKFMIT